MKTYSTQGHVVPRHDYVEACFWFPPSDAKESTALCSGEGQAGTGGHGFCFCSYRVPFLIISGSVFDHIALAMRAVVLSARWVGVVIVFRAQLGVGARSILLFLSLSRCVLGEPSHPLCRDRAQHAWTRHSDSSHVPVLIPRLGCWRVAFGCGCRLSFLFCFVL